ncbi:TauD/TfdA family dioxygenase [Spirulina sp. 06S082]|uniref:TauD/TfdA family dioxygenase n=1 Tax=Spirulina sp. 06S082 TaxID=3110248 RepID=UPI002B1F5D74|nr:TauD/TfdA family dioxygenase [Spirulina sp. 06S082]MEA5469995.1 TauD/TfdA family dioxygenase [Spirulina sp. 06S082]
MTTLVRQLKRTFAIASVASVDNGVSITWKDGHESFYHDLWLRDACHCSQCFQENTLSLNSGEGEGHDPLKMPLDPIPETVKRDREGNLDIIWGGEEPGHHSVFDPSWLRVHCQQDPILQQSRKPQLWDASVSIPHFTYHEVMKDNEILLLWLEKMLDLGVAIIDDVPKNKAGFQSLIERVGPIQQRYHPTHIFTLDTGNKLAGSIHHAYQYMQHLHNHTDHVSYNVPPRLQFLGCIEYNNPDNDKQAYSTLVDGFKIADVLRVQQPKYFQLLTQEYVPTGRRRLGVEEKVSDREKGTTKYQWETYHRQRVINLDRNGEVYQIRHHEKDRVPLDVSPDKIQDLYAAYQTFTTLAESPEYNAEFLIEPGQVLVNDNWRLLHGRTAIHNPQLRRILLGAYMKPETFRSRLRLLLGKKSEMPNLWLMGCSDRALEILADRMTA